MAYSRGWKANGWRNSDRKAVLNPDLWGILDAAAESKSVEWVRQKAEGEVPLGARL